MLELLRLAPRPWKLRDRHGHGVLHHLARLFSRKLLRQVGKCRRGVRMTDASVGGCQVCVQFKESAAAESKAERKASGEGSDSGGSGLGIEIEHAPTNCWIR